MTNSEVNKDYMCPKTNNISLLKYCPSLAVAFWIGHRAALIVLQLDTLQQSTLTHDMSDMTTWFQIYDHRLMLVVFNFDFKHTLLICGYREVDAESELDVGACAHLPASSQSACRPCFTTADLCDVPLWVDDFGTCAQTRPWRSPSLLWVCA